MADHDDLDAAELASAYLDGEATTDERARVENDPALLAEVERLRRVRDAVADVAAAPAAARESAITAALSAFDELPRETTPPEQNAPANVVPLDRRRQTRLMQGLTAVAAAALLVVGGIVIANRGGDDDDELTTARDPQPADTTAASASVAVGVTTTTVAATTSAPAPAAAPSTTAATGDSLGAAENVERADEPMLAAPTEAAAAEAAPEAAAATAAGSLRVIRDATELGAVAQSLEREPPSVADAISDCEDESVQADAVFEDAGGVVTEIVVASTADGYAAVSLADCTIVLRAPT
jgi:hypothetical protein